jgi:Virulence-associated protein E
MSHGPENMPDDDDEAHEKDLQTEDDILKSPDRAQKELEHQVREYLVFLAKATKLLQSSDIFATEKPNPNEWLELFTSTSKETFAEIEWFKKTYPDHERFAEIKYSLDAIMVTIRARFNSEVPWKDFIKDLESRASRIKRLKEEGPSERFTTETIPNDKWFAQSGKDNIILRYAVSNARNIELSCRRLPATVLYDPFDGTYRIERNGEIKNVSTGRMVRSQLLVPIANKFGYEARRDHFDDWIDSVKSDETRHYDSLTQYYDGFEAHYDPDFECIDEMIDICDTENDDYTREGLRSFVLGHIQRAYFPGCELQRIITLIGGENIGKSSLIIIKAGNLHWDAKRGIEAKRWYSNKSIISAQMSDRDRHSACIGINMFEFDERRGQKAIENEHFRSFVTSTYDDFRIWQGMEPVRVLRRWDMVASSNSDDYNSDGFIRRDWGINVGVHNVGVHKRRINLPKFLELYNKITAWAVHHVKKGMSAIPNYDLYEKAKIKQRSRIRQTDTMDFLEPVFAFAHLFENPSISGTGAYHIQEKYHISFKDDKNTEQRIYMIDQNGLSNFASDYKRFYNRSGNTEKHAIKNDILNIEVRPIVDDQSLETDVRFMWKPMSKPAVMWSTRLDHSIRGYILVLDTKNDIALMSSFASKIILQELPFIEALLNIHSNFNSNKRKIKADKDDKDDKDDKNKDRTKDEKST